MRTTITLQTPLWERARAAAESAGITFSALVEEALRERLARLEQPACAPPFELVTFGGDGLRAGVRWADLEDLDPEVERFLAADPPVPPYGGGAAPRTVPRRGSDR